MKLRNKLILSCAALAAVATTAVSTTYAWYTNNTNVTAEGIQAKTNESGADLLMIADGLNGSGEAVATANLSWKTAIENVNEYVPEAGMLPLALNGSGYLQALDTATGKTGAGTTADASGYLHFVFYLRNASTSADATVSMTITQLENVASDYSTAMTFANLPTKAIVKNDDYTNALSLSSNVNYKVDALRVLAVDLETTIVGASTTTSEASYKLAKSTYLTGTNDAATVTGGSAVDYYNDVMTPAVPLDATDATSKGSADHTATWTLNTAVTDFVTVPSDTAGDASKYVKLDFKVYLDGWDVNCYDACQGQYFKMAFSFDVQ